MREYPYGWLGILAAVAPSSDELIYAYHERGFALHSLRSPEISRLYLQAPGRGHRRMARRPDLGGAPRAAGERRMDAGEGPIVEKGVTAMRSFVVEPMRTAGSSSPATPPTSCRRPAPRGSTSPSATSRVLAEALVAWYLRADRRGSTRYSATCLRRVWRAEHFSWWMTTMLHRFPTTQRFEISDPAPQLRYVDSSRAAATSLAENYVGLEF